MPGVFSVCKCTVKKKIYLQELKWLKSDIFILCSSANFVQVQIYFVALDFLMNVWLSSSIFIVFDGSEEISLILLTNIFCCVNVFYFMKTKALSKMLDIFLG